MATPTSYRRPLHGATSGPEVRLVQTALIELGMKPGIADGVYGPHTAAAVREFQRRTQLHEDGLVGPDTWQALSRSAAGEDLRKAPPFRGLMHGATGGADVSAVQAALRQVELDPGPEDGVYGPRTAAAVRQFQQREGLAPDGVVGRETWAALTAGPTVPATPPSLARAYRIATGVPTTVLAVGEADGRPVAVIGAQSGGLTCRDLATGERVGPEIPSGSGAPPVAAAIAGRYVVSRWDDLSVVVRDLFSGRTVDGATTDPDPLAVTPLSAVMSGDTLYWAQAAAEIGGHVWSSRQPGGAVTAHPVDMSRPLSQVVVFPSAAGVACVTCGGDVVARWPLDRSVPDVASKTGAESTDVRVSSDIGGEITGVAVGGTTAEPVIVLQAFAGLSKWRSDSLKLIPGWGVPASGPFAVAGESVYVAEPGEVRRHDLGSGELVEIIEVPGDAVAIAAAGEALAVLNDAGELWARTGGRPADPVDWQDDAPAREDALRRRPLADAIARRLRLVASGNSVFLVHLDGPWGAGKSTVLGFLADELTREKPPWLLVPYNAWRQAGVGPPWWALMAALRDTVKAELSWFRRLVFRVRGWLRLRFGGSAALVTVVLLGALAAAFFLWLRPARLTDMATYVQGAAAVLTALGTLWAGVLAATRVLSPRSQRGARLFEESDGNPRDSVARHFGWLVEQSPWQVAIIIDDLDRCPAPYVVELLESIHTLIKDTSRSVAVVVAADGTWLRQAFEETYAPFAAAVAEPGRPLGYLFLDKIFQLSVPMPTIGPQTQRGFVTGLLGTAGPLEGRAEVERLTAEVESARDDAEMNAVLAGASQAAREEVAPVALARQTEPAFRRATEHRLQKYLELLPPNPRAIKRFLNDYTMLRAVRTAEGVTLSIDTLALWTILRTRWPQLAEHLAGDPDDVTRIGTEIASPSAVEALFSVPAIVHLVQFPYGGPLTADDIRACSGAG